MATLAAIYLGPLQISVLATWLVVAIVVAIILRIILQERRKDRILCLLYHRIVPADVYAGFKERERIFSVSAEQFTAQLDWLQDKGHHFVSMDQVVAYLKEGTQLPDKPVFLSFDDGCESVYSQALPLLSKRNVPATVFVTTDADTWIFNSGEYHERRMTEAEIKACHEGGIRVHSHAVSHRGLNEMSRDDALHEMVESKRLLSEWISDDVRFFSIPLNFYNRTTLKLCQEAGYEAVCVCDGATTNGATSAFRIRRFIVEGSWGLRQFENSLQPRSVAQRRVISFLKKVPPKLLGEKRWMPLRARIFRSRLGPRLNFPNLRRAVLIVGLTIFCGLLAATFFAFP